MSEERWRGQIPSLSQLRPLASRAPMQAGTYLGGSCVGLEGAYSQVNLLGMRSHWTRHLLSVFLERLRVHLPHVLRNKVVIFGAVSLSLMNSLPSKPASRGNLQSIKKQIHSKQEQNPNKWTRVAKTPAVKACGDKNIFSCFQKAEKVGSCHILTRMLSQGTGAATMKALFCVTAEQADGIFGTLPQTAATHWEHKG